MSRVCKEGAAEPLKTHPLHEGGYGVVPPLVPVLVMNDKILRIDFVAVFSIDIKSNTGFSLLSLPLKLFGGLYYLGLMTWA